MLPHATVCNVVLLQDAEGAFVVYFFATVHLVLLQDTEEGADARDGCQRPALLRLRRLLLYAGEVSSMVT